MNGHEVNKGHRNLFPCLPVLSRVHMIIPFCTSVYFQQQKCLLATCLLFWLFSPLKCSFQNETWQVPRLIAELWKPSQSSPIFVSSKPHIFRLNDHSRCPATWLQRLATFSVQPKTFSKLRISTAVTEIQHVTSSNFEIPGSSKRFYCSW